MSMQAKVAAKLAELPDSPGVYQLKNSRGRVIYIGKALSLKNRVPTYFQASAVNDPRIAHMVRQIHDLDWTIVPSELDALMLESSLVRQFRPAYNTMLKDDKSYPYIKITNEPYPRVMLTRRYLPDKARYWGPLTSVAQVRSAVRFIAGLFQLRTCKLAIDGKTFYPKPCLDYHLKLCSAPCTNYISREEYGVLVRSAADFFNGNYGRVIEELKQRMDAASGRKEYENAARYRDLIDAAEKSVARQRVIGKPGENLDVIGIARSKDKACVLLMPVRDGRLVGERKFVLNHRMEDSAGDDVLAGFLKLHYGNPQNVPPELVLPYEPAGAGLLAQWMGRLRSSAYNASEAQNTKKVVFTYPQRGHKRELLSICLRNAQERLHTVLLGEDSDYVITPGQRALAAHLALAEIPRRIEGFDISNIKGKQATGAMVVFTGGRKSPGSYRLFNIRMIETSDDYAMIRETLSRRLKRLLTDPKWDAAVDLIMVDGGKGHLSAAQDVFFELRDSPDYSAEQREKLEGIKLCSLAKQEELVYHYDEAGQFQELRLNRTDPGLRLLIEVRNEAHRYSNLQHSKMRDRAMRASVLDTIPGLGPIRQAALLKYFGSAKKLRQAPEEELAGVKGIGKHFAKHIRRYLDRDAGLEEVKAVRKREMLIQRKNRRGRG
ncbi:excinuclease ABC subunit UvrC [bacterium]|nr:excinuclease ABC subunit UvrC [bacterium]